MSSLQTQVDLTPAQLCAIFAVAGVCSIENLRAISVGRPQAGAAAVAVPIQIRYRSSKGNKWVERLRVELDKWTSEEEEEELSGFLPRGKVGDFTGLGCIMAEEPGSAPRAVGALEGRCFGFDPRTMKYLPPSAE